MHEIDDASPLYGIDADKLKSGEAVVIRIVVVNGALIIRTPRSRARARSLSLGP
jgi:hypothetical protein